LWNRVSLKQSAYRRTRALPLKLLARSSFRHRRNSGNVRTRDCAFENGRQRFVAARLMTVTLHACIGFAAAIFSPASAPGQGFSDSAHDFRRLRAHIEAGGHRMATTSARLLLWSPRILGIAVSLFIGLFALDAFSHDKTLVQALPDFLIHLIPALVLLALVGMSFRREWIGGIAFIGLAVVYATTMALPRGHVDWVFVISGPLLIVGALFLWSWFHHSQLRPGQ
jgi:hypothetical protein